MIYLFLIKKFNEPESMFQLGSALLTGDSIIKNHTQGAKFIKVAAQEYKHSKSINKMKTLTKISSKNKDKIEESDED
jgi:tRNA uridine 5-carbamoylmethylation protein Kti12